jgi:hypothetical protein
MDVYEHGYHDFVLGPQGQDRPDLPRGEVLLQATLDALELTVSFVSHGRGAVSRRAARSAAFAAVCGLAEAHPPGSYELLASDSRDAARSAPADRGRGPGTRSTGRAPFRRRMGPRRAALDPTGASARLRVPGGLAAMTGRSIDRYDIVERLGQGG